MQKLTSMLIESLKHKTRRLNQAAWQSKSLKFIAGGIRPSCRFAAVALIRLLIYRFRLAHQTPPR
jgi:hypothetical protein